MTSLGRQNHGRTIEGTCSITVDCTKKSEGPVTSPPEEIRCDPPHFHIRNPVGETLPHRPPPRVTRKDSPYLNERHPQWKSPDTRVSSVLEYKWVTPVSQEVCTTKMRSGIGGTTHDCTGGKTSTLVPPNVPSIQRGPRYDLVSSSSRVSCPGSDDQGFECRNGCWDLVGCRLSCSTGPYTSSFGPTEDRRSR